MKKKAFRKVVTNITYYGEYRMKFWQKWFFSAPRTFTSNIRGSRIKAERIHPPSHEQFGMVFRISTYSSITERIQ